MKLRASRNRRIRLRLVLLAVLSLLLQQVALAAYVCSAADVSTADVTMTVHCDGMPMTDAQQVQGSALCAAHCAQQTPATSDAHAPIVPPVSVPALMPTSIALATLPTMRATYAHAAAWRRSGTPPTLRFRVLLI